MKEGKDIVDISAPFVAGIVAGSLTLRYWGHGFASASLSFLLLCGLLAALLLKRKRPRRLQELLPVLFLTGFWCYCAQDYSQAFSLSPVHQLTNGFMQDAASLIDQIPFGDSRSNALMKALLLGDRSDLGSRTISTFRDSGAAHILALSGLHLGIIYLFINQMMKILGNSLLIRWIRSVIILLIAGFYVAATGASPSLVRAFLFILIREMSVLMNRRTQLSRTLCSALVLQLVFTPEAIEEIGFQLSYLAMAGICWIYPSLKGWYPAPSSPTAHDFPLMRKLWEASALTISCQVFTAPAVWYYFNTFPLHFLLTNLIALPLTTATMNICILLFLSGLINKFPTFLAEIGNYLLTLLMEVMEIIANL